MRRCELQTDPKKREVATQLTAGMAELFPAGIEQPALRALAREGYRKPEDLAGAKAADLAKLHGVGPKALRLLKPYL